MPPESPLPVACSLGPDDVRARIDEWQSLLATVEHREAIAGGWRLLFAQPAPLAEIAKLAGAEHDCCPAFSFSLTIDARGVALEVTAPADAQVLIESLLSGSG